MTDCKLALLETSFSPDKIRMVIELVPVDDAKFDLDIEGAGKKLSNVANYARTTFEVKAVPVGPKKATPEGDTGLPMQGDVEKAEKEAARLARSAKNMEAANKRAIATFENELAAAKEQGDKELISKAEANLQRVKDRIVRRKEESGTEA